MRRLWALDTFAYSIRVFIALASLMGVCWSLDQMPRVVPLFLGVVACALAETDDNWRGRLQALVLTLLCFAGASFAVQALFPYRWLFLVGMVLATFSLTMLGAISRRYQAIAYGTLILSIYTTIGMDQRADQSQAFWLEPALLLAGAGIYGLLSVLWCALFVHQPVQQNLAVLFRELDGYLRLKSTLFEPVIEANSETRRIALAQHSGRVVVALNTAKETLFNRVDATRASDRMNHYLRLYFIAQDVHERASSSHCPYDDLIDAFFHSDVLFRCQRLMRLQGRACGQLARAILLRVPFDKGDDSAQAVRDLRSSLDHLQRQQKPQWLDLLGSLGALAHNLETLDAELSSAGNPDADIGRHDGALFDRSPRSWRDAIGRVRQQLSLASPLFRHAFRLSVALAAGYGLMHLIHVHQGYWILLTTVFVCQPSFGATRKRMSQRMAGTLLGLVAGWALFNLFPSLLLQSVFAVVAGVVFFIMRTTRYTVATASMTLVILMCFNQVGDGHVLFVPRIIDTLIGSLLAGLAVFLVLPDWQGRRLDGLASRTLVTLASYLHEVMAQYQRGKRDDLAYRLARRNAHNADAALSTVLANMGQEPGRARHERDSGLQFLVRSHTMLNYISGLGAHRQLLDRTTDNDKLIAHARRITMALDAMAQRQISADFLSDMPPDATADAPDEALSGTHRLVHDQLRLLSAQLGPLRDAAAALAA